MVVLMLKLGRKETEGTSDIYIRSNASESPEDLRVNFATIDANKTMGNPNWSPYDAAPHPLRMLLEAAPC
jgi:hypothetical protein